MSFGLVNVPVKLFSATSAQDVRFNQLDSSSGSRIKLKRVSALTGEVVPNEQIVRGYEVAPDQYVVVTNEELSSLDPKARRTIEVEDFVPLEQIDPVFFDSAYHLVPSAEGAKAYSLLVEAMTKANKVAIGSLVMRTKQHAVALRPKDGALMLEILYYADEVVNPVDLPEWDHDQELKQRELEMAVQLIEALTVEFDPERYKDEYREKVLALIQAKSEGREFVSAGETETEAEVVDLVAALEASIKATRKTG